jgi:hypothetical protein
MKPSTIWTIGSALGTLIGAVLALILFPSAAFARNPTGQFGWNLVGFALAIGIPMGLSQWWVLRHILKSRSAKKGLFLHLWIPVTSVGIAVMILPLWWYDAEAFLFMPWLVAYPMFPGMILLGVTQWFLLYQLISARFTWALLTIMGAAIGSILGLVIAFFLPLPLELTWSFVTGGSIGLLQAIGLSSNLPSDRSEEIQAS